VLNTCDDDDPYWLGRGFPTPMIDNVENFMEYSYCFKMFTIGQGDRMTAALNSTTGGRNNLWQPDNLAATGVKRDDANTDALRVYVSKDCGATWSLRKSISSTTISTAANTNGDFAPANSSEWRTEEIVLTSTFNTENFRVRFEFTSGGGNNFYLDDINITGEYPNLSLNTVYFIADKYEIMEGETINFTDLSFYGQNTWQWTFEGADITSSFDQNPQGVRYSTEGVYFVKLNVSDGVNSIEKTINSLIKVVSNEQLSSDMLSNTSRKIKLYPNPSEGRITIDFGQYYSSVNIDVKDVLGRVVYSVLTSGESHEVELVQNTGVYFVTFTTSAGVLESKKLILK
jgi:PKD repeat protein